MEKRRFNNGMKILPVLDVQRGRVVRGVAGRRHAYQPLTPTCDPIAVARAFRERFGLTELYLADLDAIAGASPDFRLYSQLRQLGFTLWVDAGVRDAASAQPLLRADIDSIVVGLETVAGPAALREVHQDGAERVVFSLDLREGEPLGDLTGWHHADPRSIAQQAMALGVLRLLLLDLARVGMNAGIGTESLASTLMAACPHVEVSVGGGVRGVEDLRRLRAQGVHRVLVASALHDGRLQREDLLGL
jgi:phosphoribosylformimino-5-aminoimidazole carboxamide ribotide isomerase